MRRLKVKEVWACGRWQQGPQKACALLMHFSEKGPAPVCPLQPTWVGIIEAASPQLQQGHQCQHRGHLSPQEGSTSRDLWASSRWPPGCWPPEGAIRPPHPAHWQCSQLVHAVGLPCGDSGSGWAGSFPTLPRLPS